MLLFVPELLQYDRPRVRFQVAFVVGCTPATSVSLPVWSFRAATVCHPAQGGSVARLLVSTLGAEVVSVRVASFAPLCAPCTVGRMSRVPAYFGGVLGRSAVVVDAARSWRRVCGGGGLIMWYGGGKVGFCVSCLAVLRHDGAGPPRL